MTVRRTPRIAIFKFVVLSLFMANVSVASVSQVIGVDSVNDDAEQSGASVSVLSEDLELIHAKNRQKVGIRFNNVAISQGLKVTGAYIQFQVDETGASPTNLKITGQAADNAVAFSNSNDILSREETAAYVLWSPPEWQTVGESGADQQTTDLSPVIQDIINRPGWESGNSLVVLFQGYGVRRAVAFDGEPSGAPRLHLEYLEPSQNAPSVNAGPDQVISLPGVAVLDGSFTDDGLPASPGVVTTVWTQIDGDGEIQFSDATSLYSTVSFSKAGTYKLQLTAFDGERFSSDTVILGVQPAMAAPVIYNFSPASAQVAGAIIISGENFSSVQHVSFAGVEADFDVISDSVIHATVPPNAITDSIAVNNAWGSADSATDFIVLSSPAVLVGAGDIADCAGQAEQTAQLVDAIPGTVFVPGDLAYEIGSESNFADCFHPTWGRHAWRTRPIPGNHEYGTLDAAPYFQYFGAAAGDPSKGYYSYDIGEWHIVALNSECVDVGGCSEGSPQAEWLREDLAKHPNLCTMAYVHRPRYGSNNYSDTIVEDLWKILYQAGADLVVSGHAHFYERFAPQDFEGNLSSVGAREIVVGTGGVPMYPITVVEANSEVRIDDTRGVLKLTLNSGSYDWEFITVGAQAIADFGSDSCIQTNQAPYVDAGPDQLVSFPAAGLLDGTVIDDGLPDPTVSVTRAWSQVSGNGIVTFDDINDPATTVLFPSEGRYVLRLSADDGQYVSTDEVTIDALAPGSEFNVIELSISDSFDDVEERLSSGAVSAASSDLELAFDAGTLQSVGMRFNNLGIPSNATVLNAYLQFQVDEISTDAADLIVLGELEANSSPFTTVSGNVTGRVNTSAVVAWQPQPWPTVGASGVEQQTPDLSAIVQEIVSLPDWMSGNSLALIVEGSGQRVAESFDGNAAAAPKLHVEFLSVANEAPTVTITAPEDGGQAVTGTSLIFNGTADDDSEGDIGSELNWSSSIDDVIGAGSSFAATLSVGVHTITASVADSEGLVGSDLVTIEIIEVPLVDVPNVTGQVQAAAESNLVAGSLTVGAVTTAASASVPTGSVISQAPEACLLCVSPTTAVELVVSSGPAPGC